MSEIYKSLQPKDIRTTPYRAHKSVILSGDGLGLIKEYEAEFSTSSSYNFYEQGVTNIDYGNDYYTGEFATTTDGYYKKGIHSQLDHLFYREYINNPKGVLGGGPPMDQQYRYLGTKAKVISYPTKVIGEGILKESLVITASGYTIVDDIRGNLKFASGGSNGITSYDAADLDNVMVSYTFNSYYNYINEGTVPTIDQRSTYGSYKLHAYYTNLSFGSANSSGSVEAIFTPANSSSIKLAAPSNALRQVYNMQNRDYAIGMRVKLTSAPAPGSKAVLVEKRDKITDYAVDLDGNLYTDLNTPSQYPYKIEVDDDRKVVVSKSDRLTTISATSTALNLNTLYDIVLQRTGSNLELWINGSKNLTLSDVFFASSTLGTNYQSREKDCGNECNIYVGNSYDGTSGLSGSLSYIHFFDRSLTANEITNLNENFGFLGNYCGNVYYNLGLVVLTHPKLVNASITKLSAKSTVSLREMEVYCTVGPGDFNVTYNRSLHYWNPIHDRYEVDSRFTGSLFRPYVTTVGLYNDNNELLAVAKMSTPIQTSKKTDTTFVLRLDF
tara:strand:- start:1329 stop:2990 length:1662 start_codon:yes stop_codon:yes gene_type:complete